MIFYTKQHPFLQQKLSLRFRNYWELHLKFCSFPLAHTPHDSSSPEKLTPLTYSTILPASSSFILLKFYLTDLRIPWEKVRLFSSAMKAPLLVSSFVFKATEQILQSPKVRQSIHSRLGEWDCIPATLADKHMSSIPQSILPLPFLGSGSLPNHCHNPSAKPTHFLPSWVVHLLATFEPVTNQSFVAWCEAKTFTSPCCLPPHIHYKSLLLEWKPYNSVLST